MFWPILMGWWLLLAWLVPAHAQNAPNASPVALSDFSFVEPYFEAVGDTDAIGDSVITALVQDRKGFLWIGTTKGLIQYDGYRFRRYTHNPRDPRSLNGEYIITLAWGDDNRLWIGTNSDGLSAFDPVTEEFENFRHDAALPNSISAGRIWALSPAQDGGMFIATDYGLDHLPRQSKVFDHHRHDPNNPASLQDNHVRSLLRDRNGDVWIGLSNGLQRLPKNSKQFERFEPNSAIGSALAGQEIRSLLFAQDGKLWLGSRKKGAAWLDLKQQTLQWSVDETLGAKSSNLWIKQMVQAPNGQIWLATVGAGLFIVDGPSGRVVRRVQHDSAISSSLALDDMGALLIDRAGLLWVGTWGGGLQRHHLLNQAIQLLHHSPSQARSLSSSDVRSTLDIGGGQILVGTYGKGIDILDRKRGVVGGYRAAPDGNLPSNFIVALAQTADGAIWAGSQQSGLLKLEQGAREWQIWGLAQGLPGLQLRSLLVAKNGDVWAGTTLGVARLRAGGTRFESFPTKDGRALNSAVEIIVEDAEQNIWFGTSGGVWRWQFGSGGLQVVAHDAKRADSLASDDIRGLLVDKQNQLWVGTPQGLDKLKHWRDGQAQFEHISADMPLPMEPGENLLLDEAGRIWSDSFVYDPKMNRAYMLTRADGFDIGTPWLASYSKTRDGLFLYGGTNGLAIIDPQRYQPWSYQPPVVVSELKINGKPDLVRELAQELTLSPQRRNFSLEFAALDYSSPGKLHYSYRLLGYERDWIETDANHRVASYGNLWPGRYLLQVRATNRLGQFSQNQLEIPVRVLPAFWQTSWFIFCAVLLSAALVYGGYHWRLARMRANARHLRSLVEARTADILNLAEIGRDLTSTLDTEQAFERVYQQVRTRLDAHVFMIVLMNEARDGLIFVYEVEDGVRQAVSEMAITERDRPAVWCVREQSELITTTRDDLLKYTGQILPPLQGSSMQTIVYIPLIVEQQVLGCLSVQSPQVNAYSQGQIEFLRVLVSYTAIAIANAGAHSRLSSAHAELAAAHLHLKETQNKLIHSEKMASLGGLVAGIAHEVNTPLGTTLMAISGTKQTLEDLQLAFASGRIAKSEFERKISEGMDFAQLAIKTAHRAASLIETFKAIAVSSVDDDVSEFDLPQFLRELMIAAYKNLQAPGCDYVLELPPQMTVQIVQSALQEALIRVLDNVLVHAFADGKQGTLRVSLRLQADDSVMLQLSDNGHGISQQHLPRVFDPFFTTKGGDQGHVGLGLHVAYNHVTQGLHGEIHIASTPGQGCCVTLCFARRLTPPSQLSRKLTRANS